MTMQYMTIREVADLLGVDRSTLYRWRRAGIGPPWIRIGGVVLYPYRDLHEYNLDCMTDVWPKGDHTFMTVRRRSRRTEHREPEN